MTRARQGGLARLKPGPRAIGDEFCAHDRYFPWRVDPEPHLASFQSHDSHADVVADVELFQELSCQHQHEIDPHGKSQVEQHIRSLDHILARGDDFLRRGAKIAPVWSGDCFTRSCKMGR
jgi:hypothetical protein